MKKLFLSLFVLAAFSLLLTETVYAQSSVWFCKETGSVGYAYGYEYYTAYDKGYDACIEYGGVDPVLVVSTEYRGYGAIAIGEDYDGYRVIGAAVGYSNRREAERRAKDECRKSGGYDIYILDSWNDD